MGDEIPDRDRPVAALRRQAEIVAAFRRQAEICAALDSPFTGELCARAAEDIAAGGPVADLVAGWRGDLEEGILPLRLAGGLHFLALAGRAPEYSAHLPSPDREPRWPEAWEAARAIVAREGAFLARFLESPPQTNEVARAATLIGGFLTIARETGRPLALAEIGASAGLLLNWDRYRYETPGFCWGPTDARLVLSPKWFGPPPPLGPVEIVSRRGCDLAPLDLSDPEARLRLRSYVWPDQPARLAALDAALVVAEAHPPIVDRAGAADWLEKVLPARPSDAALVVHHSYVWPYLPEEEQDRVATLIAEAGARADARAPLAWLRMEQNAARDGMEVLLDLWPDAGRSEGARRRLAFCHPHGRWVDWRGPS